MVAPAFFAHGQPIVLIRVGKKLPEEDSEDPNEDIGEKKFFSLDNIHRLTAEGRILGVDVRGIIALYEDLLNAGKLPC